jgi:hypothetical protein
VASDAELRAGVAQAIEPYRELLEQFVRGDISANDFESRYLNTYLSDDSLYPDDVFEVVDAFFAEAESYEGDPRLRPHVHRATGPDELRQRAEELLRVAGYAVHGRSSDLGVELTERDAR